MTLTRDKAKNLIKWMFVNAAMWAIAVPVIWFSIQGIGVIEKFLFNVFGLTFPVGGKVRAPLMGLVGVVVGGFLGWAQKHILKSRNDFDESEKWILKTVIGTAIGAPLAVMFAFPFLYLSLFAGFGVGGVTLGILISITQILRWESRRIKKGLWVIGGTSGLGFGFGLGVMVINALGYLVYFRNPPGFVDQTWHVVQWFVHGAIAGLIYGLVSGSILYFYPEMFSGE